MDKNKIENVLKMIDDPDQYDKESFVMVCSELVLEIQESDEKAKRFGTAFLVLDTERTIRETEVLKAENEVLHFINENKML